ncbi:MAG: hypothetical protein D3916_12950 [Candidatus Electrothrix sp. MAN1_4]|nr:hypothetical protein [Candidatus Electrothrix sp. MAN1_4]
MIFWQTLRFFQIRSSNTQQNQQNLLNRGFVGSIIRLPKNRAIFFVKKKEGGRCSALCKSVEVFFLRIIRAPGRMI